MKNIFIILFLASTALNAQMTEKELVKHQEAIEKSLKKEKGVISQDTLFFMGKPYCIVKAQNKFLGTIMNGTIKDLNGNDAIWILFKSAQEMQNTQNMSYTQFTFVSTEEKAFFREGLEKTIIKNNLFVNGLLDNNAVRKFLNDYPDPRNAPGMNSIVISDGSRIKIGNTNVQIGNNTPPAKVARNTNAPIFTFNGNIQQDNKIIGTYTETKGSGECQINIFSTDGRLIAQAKGNGAAPVIYSVISAFNGISSTVSVRLAFEAQDIAKHLIVSGLL